MDFNAAKYMSDSKNEDTSLLGTKGYAAPEQYGFGVSTIQTDIYAIGMLMKEMTPNLENPGNEFTPIISKCTRLNATERYCDIDSLICALNNQSETKLTTLHSSLAQYLPPGFRSLRLPWMILSGLGYAFIFWLCLSMEIEGMSPGRAAVDKILCLLMVITVILFSANYANVQKHFKICQTENIFLRILSVIFLDALLILIFIIITILIETLIP